MLIVKTVDAVFIPKVAAGIERVHFRECQSWHDLSALLRKLVHSNGVKAHKGGS